MTDLPLIEIRWTSRGAPSAELVVTLEVVDLVRALIESWLDRGGGSRTAIVTRRTVPCTITEDDEFVHLDVRLEGRRAVAISLARADDGPHYVHCDLGAETGIGRGGAYDPPTVRRLVAEPDAATA